MTKRGSLSAVAVFSLWNSGAHAPFSLQKGKSANPMASGQLCAVLSERVTEGVNHSARVSPECGWAGDHGLVLYLPSGSFIEN